MAQIQHSTLDQFKQDPDNANLGTAQGADLLRHSLQKLKAGRGLLADADGVLIAGNKTQLAAIEAGITKVVVVETDGSEIVITKRTDLHPGDPVREELAIADNKTSEIGLQWDPAALKAKWKLGIDPTRYGWHPEQYAEQIKQRIEKLKELETTPFVAQPEPEPSNGESLGRDDKEYHFVFDLDFDDSILVDRALKEWEIKTGRGREEWLVEMSGAYLRDDDPATV